MSRRGPRGRVRDAIAWSAGLGLAAIATIISLAAGARLGAALTAGAITLVIVVVAALATEPRD